jgi:ribosomal protein S18 acetylase RimI-like enzyme
MEYRIIEIMDNSKKTEYTNLILRKLPEWFGNERGLLNYVNTVYEYPFWAAFDNNNCIGFFSGKIHYNRTGDIYVCGIDPNYHGKGIGTALYKKLEEYFIKNNCEYIIVQTLCEIAKYEPYLRTKNFYIKLGFKELISFKEIWDEENPLLIMIKNIK